MPSRNEPLGWEAWASMWACWVIRAYQWTTAWVPKACRFYPSCSHYALGAFQKDGFWRGGWKTICRLARCHPSHPGGVDYP